MTLEEVMNPSEVLSLPMQENDAGAKTIREYLVKLLETLWQEHECFNAKRPFGFSGWKYDIYASLVQAKAIGGDAHLHPTNQEEADALIEAAIRTLANV